MEIRTNNKWLLGSVALVAAFLVFPITGSAEDKSEAINDALDAAWPGMAENATVVDWEGSVLREGSNGYTCLPTPPTLEVKAPMCMDSEWMEWADAWSNKTDYAADALGISYMLAGDDSRACRIDRSVPYGPGQWRSVRHVERDTVRVSDGSNWNPRLSPRKETTEAPPPAAGFLFLGR